jgi:hypothetical protein
MSGKLLILVTLAALLSTMNAPSARELVRLTDNQLDNVTAGADFSQMPPLTSLLVNGSNGAGGVNQFSPSIATLVPTVTSVNVCVFCIITATKR